MNVRLCRSLDNIRRRTAADDGPLSFAYPDRDLALGIGTASNRPDIVLYELSLRLGQFFDRLQGRINRAVPQLGGPDRRSVYLHLHGSRGYGKGTAGNGNVGKLVLLPSFHHFLIGHDGVQVLVKHLLLQVSQRLETLEGLVEHRIVQVVAEFLKSLLESMSAGMLPQDQDVGLKSHRLWGHDFVRALFHQHAMLVDPRFVGEGIGPHYRLVGLNYNPGHGGEQSAGGGQMLGDHVGLEGEDVAARFQCHDELLQRAVASPFADAVDGALHLPRSGLDRRDRVGYRQPQVVVAVHRNNRLVDIGDILPQVRDDVEVFK